ncbi:thyroid receptor-interacting protein 11 [Engraulis encrasicolus]|uniref:thyroid receptor-interacting protein 11 n=1 Tax=Engraulis encrasicolus TaxID=184585 RepID=UPI002FD61BCF
MSSWLGGLGSGLGQSLGQVGGSLSSITGQISNFTKDILLEGAEEVGDAATELQVSKANMEELEAALATQKYEYERLRKIHAELEEKFEASEIQNKQLSSEYRSILQQKEVEISHLKARQGALQEEVQKMQHSAPTSSSCLSSAEPALLAVTTSAAGITTTASSSSSSSSPFMSQHHHHHGTHHQGFHGGDEMDLSDVLWSQQEINRLSNELHRLEAETAHWRRLAQASKTSGGEIGDQGEILKLQRTIKELRESLGHEGEQHQHELAALQNVQRQKLAEVTRRHRQELAEYEERIEELEEQLQNSSLSPESQSPPASPSQAQAPGQQQQQQQQDAARLRELTASLEEAGRQRAALEQEREEARAENAELMQNYSRLQSCVAELQARVQEQEGKAMFKAQQDAEIQTLKKTLSGAEKEISRLKGLLESEPKAEVEHADILELNTIIGTLKAEKEELEKEKHELASRLEATEEKAAEAVVAATAVDGEPGRGVEQQGGVEEELRAQLQKKEQALTQAQLDQDTLTAELEELDRQNQEATQHLITLKDQLSRQRLEADDDLSSLQSELDASRDQKGALQQELEAMKEKLSQSAFTLNDLHMGKQQLETTVKELRDKLSKSAEQAKEVRQEAKELRDTLKEREGELESLQQHLGEAGERESESEGHRKELERKQTELEEVRKELSETRSSQEQVQSEHYEMKMENRRLKEDGAKMQSRVEELSKQVVGDQASLSRTVLEKDTRIEALKLEKSQLEGELSQAEKRLADQTKQYQQTIEELSRARSMDASALQTEHERAVRLNQEKDLEIGQLRRDLEQLASDHKDTNEMLSITVAGQKQLTELLQEKDAFAETLKAKTAEAQKQTEDMEAAVANTNLESETLKRSMEDKDKQLGTMKEENSHLKEEIDRLRDQQSRPQPMSEPRTLDIITELETEVTQLKAARDRLEEETRALRATADEQRQQSQHALQVQQSEQEQARSRHEQSTLNYERLIAAKDEEIARLQEAAQTESQTPPSTEILQQQEEEDDDKNQSLGRQENGNEKHDLSKVEIEKLVSGIKEKENEIIQLNERNLSLTKQLDQLVVSRDEVGKLSQMVRQKDLEIQALHARVTMGGGGGAGGVGAGGHSQDVLFLQQQLQAYAVEREQVLSVLNEKTRENSQLRSDYHHLMDVVAGREQALLKLQQENQRLSCQADPSGSQEMFRETIQNLSRIIREKDIEIDALTQKCQTLVTVLQASAAADAGGGGGGGGSGVSSNQFEELLQERDTLKQQVKKMEEWKQQVITTVRNMQHESAALHEELLTLQGQVSTDSASSTRLSSDYARLIHSYEQKEKRLDSLGHQLVQVQQSISQLSSTKDVLLGKLDSVAQSPEGVITSSSTTTTTMASPPPAVVVESTQRSASAVAVTDETVRQELESLRQQLAERDLAVRTLQENNGRLSNAAAASEGEQRGRAEETRLLRERLDAVQRSLREKDLLIQSKGEQLSQAVDTLRNRESDNELLRQAVTNLKERALILEMDARKLREENDQVASRSREKESEFRALQETNMQVSLLLREREFQCNAATEKATAMEKMLKDREQGKSGELNQLLNEVRSMQEKAILFQQERDQVMLALKQKQMETTAVHSEMQHLRDKEARQQQELERLRNHLLEMEESYTREVVAAEDREAELRRRVALLDERLATSSNAAENVSQQATLQVESLQEQLNGVIKQRDEALLQLRTAQEQVNQYAMSLANLQMVLEQFQQEEKAMYSAELDKHKKEKDEWRRKAERLADEAAALKLNLDEANAALDSASRLTDQLDLKEEQIEELQKQVGLRQEMLEDSQNKLMNLLNSSEGKVDKLLIRNLFLGYFHTPRNKRAEVLRLMGSVLGVDREEVDNMLEDEGRRGVTGWMSSWLGGRAVQSIPNTPQRPGQATHFNSSFSEMFVKFLEVESTPALPAPKLPMYDIKPLSAPPPGRMSASAPATAAAPSGGAGGGVSKRLSESNPFLASRSAAVPLLNPGGGGGHLLMKPISDSLPTFTPVPVSAEASGGAVLKDLLKQ